MNREEFLVKASAFIGVAVGMRDNEMVIDGPHAILEMCEDGDVFVNTPERSDFFEPVDGDYSEVYNELVPMVEQARLDFDASVLVLRAEIPKHLEAIHPSLKISVIESVDKVQPVATFCLHDTGIALYSITAFGQYLEHKSHYGTDNFSIDVHRIGSYGWTPTEPLMGKQIFEVAEDWFAKISDILGLLGSNVSYKVREFNTTITPDCELPDCDIYNALRTTQKRVFVEFTVNA